MALANPLELTRSLTPVQRRTFAAAFLGWTLDAFDFFLLTFIVTDVAKEFGVEKGTVLLGIFLTLCFRWVGAIVFGTLADRYGRRAPLMASILLYSILEFATGFSTTITMFLVLRALFGIAMGGEWGVGAALALESLPDRSRGFFSGVLQQGYATGYLLAAVTFYLVYPHFGWRAMFYVGAVPALLVLYIRLAIPESDAWREQKARNAATTGNMFAAFLKQPALFVIAILMMASFNFMSHGSQDLYPTFLRDQRHYDTATVSALAIVANIGAIIGGTIFGALSQSWGRKRAIVTSSLIGILVIPLWAFAPSAALLALGAFLLQFFVQGAWGVVPIHLNELSPGIVRGTFPGFAYQIGNLISAGSSNIENAFAKSRFPIGAAGADFGKAMAIVMVIVFLAVAIVTAIGPERKGVDFASD
jgi:SHS family lactate transporter-like MFS transporter